MIGDDKPSLEALALAHFGVKGMHWGQHKISDIVPTKSQVRTAGNAAGKAAVATGKAVVAAGSYVAHHKRLAVGALIAADILRHVGMVALHAGKTGILIKAAKNRQAAYEAGKIAAKALSSTAAKVNYAKMARGAYKITTL